MPEEIPTASFADRLQDMRARVRDPDAGVFGPESMTWRYTRDALLFAGAWRAVLLQLAHPWVSRAIEEHSETFEDPVRRFHRTFRVVWTMVFGDWARVERISLALHERHAGIRGHLTEPSGDFRVGESYFANEQQALAWVHATLIDTTVVIRELVHGPQPAADKAAYYRESKDFAALFGIDPTLLPPDWTAFRVWWDEQVNGPGLHVTDTARRMGDQVFNVKAVPCSGWWGPIARTCTAEIMPDRLRSAYRMPASSPATRRTLQRNTRRLRTLQAGLPRRFRYVPAYHEACARLDGKARAPGLTRWLSKSWIGVPELVIGRT